MSMPISDRIPSHGRAPDAPRRVPRSAICIVAALTAACAASDQPGNTAAPDPVEAREMPAPVDDGRVPCARGGAEMARICTVEQVQAPGGLLLTLRHPDGGFRRLRVATDGRGVVAADGAEPARVAVVGAGEIEVDVGGDRYRLPATVKSAAGG